MLVLLVCANVSDELGRTGPMLRIDPIAFHLFVVTPALVCLVLISPASAREKPRGGRRIFSGGARRFSAMSKLAELAFVSTLHGNFHALLVQLFIILSLYYLIALYIRSLQRLFFLTYLSNIHNASNKWYSGPRQKANRCLDVWRRLAWDEWSHQSCGQNGNTSWLSSIRGV